MSFNPKASTDRFYGAMGQAPPMFKRYVETTFLPELKKPFVRGGPMRQVRKKVVQEAVDALQCYGALNAPDAAAKRHDFEVAFRRVFNEGLPPNSPGAGVQVAKMKLINAKLNILKVKLLLLSHWERAVQEGLVPGKMSDDPNEFEKQMFLFNLYQFEAVKVKPVLQIMLNDARDVLDTKIYRTTMDSWVGADTTVLKEFSSTEVSKAVKFEATARAGFQGNAKFELEYRGLKGEMTGEVFAGIRAKLQAEGKIAPGQVSVSGNVHVDIGLLIKGDAKFDVLDLFEVNASAEGLAGAQLDVGGKIVASYDGVEFEIHGEAFAGVRIKGQATGKLKLGGREITSVKVEGAAWAGAGASAAAGFKCSVFGEISFKLKAGAAVGVGAEGGFALSLDPRAIQYGTLNLIWIYAAEHGVKNKGRVHFLPLEENHKMGEAATTALKGMITELQHQHAREFQQLEQWELIQEKMLRGRVIGA